MKEHRVFQGYPFSSESENNDHTGSIELENKIEPESAKNGAHADDSTPKELLDSLTLTLMDVPMILPCGQAVDRKNLDKFIANEAKFGRPPNDPFTGRTFTDTSHPIFNDKLKSRIDEYVLNKCGISIRDLRKNREVDYRSKTNSNYEKSIRIPINSPKKPRKNTPNKDTSDNGNSYRNDTLDFQSQSKCETNRKDAIIVTENLEIKQKEQRSHQDTKYDELYKKSLEGRKPIIKPHTRQRTASDPDITRSETPNLVAAIISEKNDPELGSTLSHKHKVVPAKRVKCVKCCYTDNDEILSPVLYLCKIKNESSVKRQKENTWYQLEPCKHFLCINCLAQTTFIEGSAQCVQCSKPFVKSQVVKYHKPCKKTNDVKL